MAAAAVVGAGLVGIGLADYSAPAVAQFKPGTPAETLSFADIVDRVKPAVVSISTTNEVKVADRGNRGPGAGPGAGPGGRPFEGIPGLPDDHPLNQFFKNMPGGPGGGGGNPMQQRPRQAAGSGFVVSADGYIVTNNHVVDGATKVKVSFDDQEEIDAKIVGTDFAHRSGTAEDRAEEAADRPQVRAEEPARRRMGAGGRQSVWPRRHSHGRHRFALARNIGGPYDYMQIDAAVNHGNSGGPTFNLEGDVVGVNTAIYSPTGGNVGIAFAVPADTVKRVVEQARGQGWHGRPRLAGRQDPEHRQGSCRQPRTEGAEGRHHQRSDGQRPGGRFGPQGRGRHPVDR